MENEKPEFIVTPSIFAYIIPTLLIAVTIACYYAHIFYIPLIILTLLTAGSLLSHNLTILVYKDRFSLRYRNYFGKLMEDNYEFYYDEVKNISPGIDDWVPNAPQSLVIIIAEIFLPGRGVMSIFRNASADLIITSQKEGHAEEITSIKISPLTDRIREALYLISAKTRKNKAYVR